MQVYLIPTGETRYELYCETSAMPAAADETLPRRAYFRKLRARFRAVLAAVEQERLPGTRAREGGSSVPGGWRRRLRNRIVCWLAERIAEQRLLWNLRREQQTTLLFPEDITESGAMDIVRRLLQVDATRHGLWSLVHLLGFTISAVLTPIPGPNLLAYYFAFRLVGHYLSRRGAQHGLRRVIWRPEPSGPLAELRQAMTLDPPSRKRRVHEVASRLQLEHLATFFERTSIRPAAS